MKYTADNCLLYLLLVFWSFNKLHICTTVQKFVISKQINTFH